MDFVRVRVRPHGDFQRALAAVAPALEHRTQAVAISEPLGLIAVAGKTVLPQAVINPQSLALGLASS